MKKLVSLLTVLMLSLQMTTVFAAGATMTFDNVTGAPGETVDVNVVLANCANIISVGYEFTYDANALEIVSVSAGDGVVTNKTGLSRVMWNAANAMDRNGTVATVSIKIKDTAAEGTYALTATHARASDDWYSDEVNYTTGFAEVPITYVSGSVTVAKPAPAGPTMNATKSGSTVSIVATPDGESFSGKFIVAGYDAEGLVAVEVLDAAATATATINADTVKVMWWDSLTGLNSIVPADTDMAK